MPVLKKVVPSNPRPYFLMRGSMFLCNAGGTVTADSVGTSVLQFNTEEEAEKWADENLSERSVYMISRRLPISKKEQLTLLRRKYEHALRESRFEDDDSTAVSDAFDALMAFARENP